MKKSLSILFILLSITLTGCQAVSNSEEITSNSKPDKNETQSSENVKKTDCALVTVQEGWHCYTAQPAFSILLPDEFKIYGKADSGNFISEAKNNFIHIGYFPVNAFDESSQKLLKDKKIKEYLEYEEKNICASKKPCPSKLLSSSFSEITLGTNQFLKYEVELNREDKTFKSIHYATIINDYLADFSSSEGEMIPNPPDSKTLVKSVRVEDKSFEEILKTLTALKK